jgi:DUF1365 family protein
LATNSDRLDAALAQRGIEMIALQIAPLLKYRMVGCQQAAMEDE